MSADTKFASGRLEDVSMCDVLEAIDRRPPSMRHALITCMDSTVMVAALLEKSPLLKRHVAQFKSVGTGLAIHTGTLLKINRMTRIFFGFDEVFFFAKRPAVAKPPRLLLVDPCPTTGVVPSRIQDWFHDTDCYLGIGDGTGLNFLGRMVGRIPGILLRTVGERVSG